MTDNLRELRYAHLMRRGAKCTDCALYQCTPPRGPVLGELRPRSRLTIVGDSPSSMDIGFSAPFSGKTGEELNAGLELGGLAREECTIVNVIACQPDPARSLQDYLTDLRKHPVRKPDGSIALDPITACSGRLRTDIVEANASTLLAVGGQALQSLATLAQVNYKTKNTFPGAQTVYSMLNQHGSPVTLPSGRILCSSLNPAFAMKGNRAYKYVIRRDIARAAQIARTNKIHWEPVKKYDLTPDFFLVCQTLQSWSSSRTAVTVDIETDGIESLVCDIRCIGLGVSDPEEYVMVLPLKTSANQNRWTPSQLQTIKTLCADVLDNNPLYLHNGMFDTIVLLQHGFMTKKMRTWDDTMILDHCTDANDLPHALGAVARRYFPVSVWKEDIDHKAAPIGLKWGTLLEYNKEDVTVTMRLAKPLQAAMLRSGTIDAYETDKKLLPIAREMETLGLFVDEHTRGEFSIQLNGLCETYEANFLTAANKKINPRSSPQVGSWLYEDCKLIPPLNPKGKEWTEGDDWSTSSQALMRLTDKEADTDPEVVKGIEALLRYRACEKLRSTYVDSAKIVQDVPHSVCAQHEHGAILPPVIDAKGRMLLPSRMSYSRMHSTYKLHVTPSGRWSSSPNCQNIPCQGFNEMNMRTMYVAPPGHLMVGADYKQVELRLYALLANDQLLLQCFAEGLDAHTLNAATLFDTKNTPSSTMELYREFMRMKDHGNAKEKKRLKGMRNIAKRFAFLEIYGGAVHKLYSVMAAERIKATLARAFPKLTPQDCEIWHERWHSSHPETKQWQQQEMLAQRQRGYAETFITHRKRFFPGGVDRENMVPNLSIQGGAGDIVNSKTLEIHDAVPFQKWSEYTGLVLQVHDFLGMYVPKEKAEEALQTFIDVMPITFGVMTFEVDDPKATVRWSDQ